MTGNWSYIPNMENRKDIAQELEEIAPLLNSISKKPVQTVPAGYFEQLNIQIPGNQAPVVSMKKATNWYRLAAAAVVTGILVLGGWQMMNESLKPLESEVGMNYAELTSLNVTDWVQQMPNESIDEYLQSANALAGSENSLHHYTVDGVTGTTVDEISDEELQLYLND